MAIANLGGMGQRVFEYREWVKSTPTKTLDELRRVMQVGYAMTGLLALLAVICLVVLIGTEPLQLQLLAGLIVLSGAAVMTFRRADTNRRGLARAKGGTVSMQGNYPLSVGDAGIHFPESFDDPAETWPLTGTVVEVKDVVKQQVIVLSHPGRTTRHFYSGALTVPVTEVQTEIEARQAASATDRGQIPTAPEGQADQEQG